MNSFFNISKFSTQKTLFPRKISNIEEILEKYLKFSPNLHNIEVAISKELKCSIIYQTRTNLERSYLKSRRNIVVPANPMDLVYANEACIANANCLGRKLAL